MKKTKKVIFSMLIVLLVSSCSPETELKEVDFSIVDGYYNCTPNEVVNYINSTNLDDNYYIIPEFQETGEEIAINGDAGTTDIYLTFITNIDGKVTEIEFNFLSAQASEQSAKSFTHYLTVILTKIVSNTETVDLLIKDVLNSSSNNNQGLIL